MLAAICITQIPESPIWLIAKGRLKQAEESLCWLRGWVEPHLVREEFQQLVRHNQNCYTSKKEEIKIEVTSESAPRPTVKNRIDAVKKIVKLLGLGDLFRRQTMQPLLLVAVFFVFHHCGGPSGSRPFMIPIFEAFHSPIDPNWATVIHSTLGLSANVLCCLVVSKIGKRLLSLISFAGCIVTNFLICIYGFFFVESGITLFPVVTYFALNFVWTFGIGQTPWLLVSEIFPLRGKGVASGVSSAVGYLLGFVVTKTFYDLQKAFTTAGVFGFYGFMMIIGSVLFYFYVPETEGKSLEEIEEIFDKKFNKTKSRSSVDVKASNTEITPRF